MIKLASELKNKPVILKKEGAIVGYAEDLVINPDNGELVGILVREGFGKNKIKALSQKDILSISTDFYLISGYDSLGDLDEIVRIKAVLDQKVKIPKSRVYTVSGIYLGKVYDYTVDLKHMMLQRLYVSRGVFAGFTNQLVIAYPQIVAIEKDKITVEDATLKVKKKVAREVIEPA